MSFPSRRDPAPFDGEAWGPAGICLRDQECDQSQRSRNGEHEEREPVVVLLRGEDGRQQYWAGNGPRLIEGFVETESPSHTERLGGVGEQRVPRRRADRLAKPFGHDEGEGEVDTTDESEERYGDHGECIPGDRQRPVGAGSVRDEPCDRAQGIAGELASTGDHPDHAGRRTKGQQVGADNASRTLVDNVGEQADDAERDDRHHCSASNV